MLENSNTSLAEWNWSGEDLFRKTFEQSPISTQILSPDGHTIWTNAAFERLWGVSAFSLADYNLLEDPQLAELGIMPFIKKGFGGEACEIPAVLYDPESTLPGRSTNPEPQRWVRGYIFPLLDSEGKVREIVLMHEDITDRRRAEETASRWMEIFNHVGWGVVVGKGDGSVLEMMNPAYAKMHGYTVGELVGRPIADVFAPESRGELRAHIARTREIGHNVYEAVHLRRDGSTFPVIIESTAIRDARGEVVSLATHVQDITEQKHYELERERLLEREREAREVAEESSRLKDEFLATVSHELRTPMTAVLGWIQLIHSGKLDQSGIAKAIETIERNARAQSRLIEDLLDVSRIISGKLRLNCREIDPVVYVLSAVDAIRPGAEAKDITVHTAITPGILSVKCDPDRLQQMVWNILSNALKFTPRGGEVNVSLTTVDSSIVIEVRDNGMGISREFMPHLFERFRQADSSPTRQHSGLGLGLSIVHHLAELHGGTVYAESDGEGTGSMFRIELPARS